MNKEELKELNNAINHCDNVIKQLKKIGNCEGCIKDHQQLKKWLINYKKIINQSAYKFDDLKPGMWVWDDRLKACFLIKAIKPKTYWNIVVYANYLTDTLEELNFEENRFYPVSKAIKKED